ncbi:hypothetical protein J5J83_19865 [Azoarcus sp. L1K30]|uniref:hypothetical protein n=1 Tax=Azoarcus sp. L1K30 TaxID=2820277 RepID=UPI001B83BCC2|nr:hypothetical protein [Azoarcus sp. L1K30]MBR0568385.1 hypothetical protein [Azoarcus sp. L1K30]
MVRYENCLLKRVRYVDDGISDAAVTARLLLSSYGCDLEREIAASRYANAIPSEQRIGEFHKIYERIGEEASMRVVDRYRENASDDDQVQQQRVAKERAERDAEWAIIQARSKMEFDRKRKIASGAAIAYVDCARSTAKTIDDGFSDAATVALAVSGKCRSVFEDFDMSDSMSESLKDKLNPAVIDAVLASRRKSRTP